MSGRPLDEHRVSRLRDIVGGHEPASSVADTGSAPRDLPVRVKGLVKRVVAKAIGWYVADSIERSTQAITAVMADRVSELERLAVELNNLPVSFELLKGEVAVAHTTAANQELLKAEFRRLQGIVEELGWALAPGAGLSGAGARISELRERVNAIDRRIRQRPTATELGDGPPPVPAPAHLVEQRRDSELFDYVGFERRFRGDREEITATLLGRYGQTLVDHAPVLDVGCGRGELLAALAERGVEVEGVDTDLGMVSEARARGLTVHHAGAVEHLRGRDPGSIGAIIATHVLEHLELDYLIELLELAASRLRPGGVFIAETPNPATLVVLGSHFILDPTHVWPLHPALLNFLCEGAGFREVQLDFYSPATELRLSRLDDPATPAWAAPLNDMVDRLNDVLFGAQDYSVSATTPRPT